MRNLVIDYDVDVSEYVVDQIFLKNNRKRIPGDYLVQMILVKEDETEEDVTIPLKIDSFGNVIWRRKWWNGEKCIKLIGFAKIEDIDLSQSFPFE